MKAFLSHSSVDKEFVRAIAKELGRQFCIIDEHAFVTGIDLKESIARGLDESSVFVLFASQNSMKSLWVEFEAEEAWYKKLRNKLPISLVYIIDSSINVENLPEWLRRALVKRENSTRAIARGIRSHLDELMRERQHPHFVGRNDDIEQLEKTLTPFDGTIAPRVVFITGLPGIGRRSLIKRVAPSILNLKRFVEIRVSEGFTVNDLCVSIADHIEPYSTTEGLKQLVQEIRKLSDQDAIQRIIKNLQALVKAGDLPILFDDGGLLDSEGYVKELIQLIVNALAPDEDLYLFLVTFRRPQFVLEHILPSIHLQPLKKDETKRLIALLSNQAKLKVSQEQIAELSEYTVGYPLRFILQFSKQRIMVLIW